MAYFSNGAEGEMYMAKWCERCIHDSDNNCPVILLHLAYNGEKDHEDLLNTLIPREGTWNKKCKMFVEV